MTKQQAYLVAIYTAAKAGQELHNLSHLPQDQVDKIADKIQALIEKELEPDPFEVLLG